MVNRLVKFSSSRSFFLFGARSTGKTTLVQKHFPEAFFVDLLDPPTESLLRRRPEALKGLIEQSQKNLIVIDEIQKNPVLLDVVHSLLSKKDLRFVLTGSSARKLKRGAANLLAGRAFSYYCFPLSFYEMGASFELENFMKFGGLPELLKLNEEEKKDYLRSYVEIYFKEEVVAEQLVRTLIPFRNFIDVAAQSNGKVINFSHIARDIQVDPATVKSYFSILEDTLVGFMLPAYHHSVRKRFKKSPKFYYFDCGVTRAITRKLELNLTEQTYDYGDAFEHFIILEFKKLIHYIKPDWRMNYFQSADGGEVDLVVERPGQKNLFIEIKSTDRAALIEPAKLRGFSDLAKDLKQEADFIILSRDKMERKEGLLSYRHWRNFLEETFNLEHKG